MRIESLARIIDGELLNFPSITYIDQLKTDAKKIKRADAYICKNNVDVKNAIDNGAYAIISEKRVSIIDDEIAWITVDSIEKALVRYLRYKTIQLESRFFLCDDITYEILKSISISKDILFLNDDLFENFSTVVNASDNAIFVCKDKKTANDIYPAYLSIDEAKKNLFKVVKHSIFLTDFIYKEKYYHDVKIPYIFTSQLNKSIKFLEKFSLDFSLENLSLDRHFNPIFVDNAFHIHDFGQTSRVLIEETSESHIEKELDYLMKYAKYAKLSLFVPRGFIGDFEGIDINRYDSFYDIINTNKQDYNFFLILNKEKKDIFAFLKDIKKIKNERSLF
jgi:ferrochelatase